MAGCGWNIPGTREVCSRDPEEVQDDGIEPEAIECYFIIVGWFHDVSSNDLFLDLPDEYETIYLLCYEHIETCSPDGCKACSEVPKGYS